MKLFYITPKVFNDRKKAIDLQILATSKEFQKRLKNKFLLVVRRVDKGACEDFEDLNFKENKCPINRARFLFYLFWIPFFAVRNGITFFFNKEPIIIYCEDWHVGLSAVFFKKVFGYKVAIEYHDPPYGFWKYGFWKDALLVRFCDYLIPTTEAMKQYLEGVHTSAKQKSCVAQNGVYLEEFANIPTKKECRAKLGLEHYDKIILYAGNLAERKGIEVLAKASEYLPNYVAIFIVGGTNPNFTENFRKKYSKLKNLVITGYRPHNEILYWMGAADAVVAPYSADVSDTQSAAALKWACPMKILEYMASKRPIVASDIPAVTQFLNKNNAVIVSPDNPEELALGIKEALEEYEKSDYITAKAFLDVQGYTWENRGDKIVKFLEK